MSSNRRKIWPTISELHAIAREMIGKEVIYTYLDGTRAIGHIVGPITESVEFMYYGKVKSVPIRYLKDIDDRSRWVDE